MSIYTTGSLELRGQGDSLFLTASFDAVGPKIGVGTSAAPGTTFAINSDLGLVDTSTQARFSIANNDANGDASINLGNSISNRSFILWEGASDKRLRFGTRASGVNYFNTMHLKDGSVGIGGDPLIAAGADKVDLHLKGSNKSMLVGLNAGSPAEKSTIWIGNVHSKIEKAAGTGALAMESDRGISIASTGSIGIDCGGMIEMTAGSVGSFSLRLADTSGGFATFPGAVSISGYLYDNEIASSGNQHMMMFPGGGGGEAAFVQTRFMQPVSARVGLHVTGSTRLKGNIELTNTTNPTMTVDARSGTDTAGRSLTLGAGQSTGTGAGGSLILQVARRGAASGAGVNSFRTALTLSDDGSSVEPGATFTGNVTVLGPTLTVGAGTTEDQKIILDGNAADYYVGIDDTDDSLIIGAGSTVGTTPALQVKGTTEAIAHLPTHVYSLGLGGTGGVVYPEGVFCIANTQRLRFNDGAELEDSGGHKRLDLVNNGTLNLYDKAGGISLVVSGAAAQGVGVEGTLQVTGHEIKNAAGDNTITLDLDQRVGIGGITPTYKLDVNGDIRLRGNDIRDNSGNAAISFDGANNTEIMGTLKLAGNVIQASDGGTAITLDTSDNVTIGGDLQVNGDDIKDSGGNTVLSFDASGHIDNKLDVRSSLNPMAQFTQTSTLATAAARVVFVRNPTDGNLSDGDDLSILEFRGTTNAAGGDIYTGARIKTICAENWDTTGLTKKSGANLLLQTTNIGTSTSGDRLELGQLGMTGSVAFKLVDAGAGGGNTSFYLNDQIGSNPSETTGGSAWGKPEYFDMFFQNTQTNSHSAAGIGFGTTSGNTGAGIIYVDRGSYARGQLNFAVKNADGNGQSPNVAMVLSGSTSVVRSDWIRDRTSSNGADYDNVIVGNVNGEIRRWTSDRRGKKDIQDLNNSLDEICQLMPRLYKDIEQDDDDVRFSPGLIADEVESVFPELVSGKDLPADKLRGVSYAALSVYIVNALKEIKQRLETLESEL